MAVTITEKCKRQYRKRVVLDFSCRRWENVNGDTLLLDRIEGVEFAKGQSLLMERVYPWKRFFQTLALQKQQVSLFSCQTCATTRSSHRQTVNAIDSRNKQFKRIGALVLVSWDISARSACHANFSSRFQILFKPDDQTTKHNRWEKDSYLESFVWTLTRTSK